MIDFILKWWGLYYLYKVLAPPSTGECETKGVCSHNTDAVDVSKNDKFKMMNLNDEFKMMNFSLNTSIFLLKMMNFRLQMMNFV